PTVKFKGKDATKGRGKVKPSYEEQDEEEEEEPEDDDSEEEESDEEDEEDEEEEDEEDLDALAKAADNSKAKNSEAAQQRIHELAKEHDIDEEEYASWTDVVEAIKEALEGGEDEVVPPEKGDIMYFKPPKAKKA